MAPTVLTPTQRVGPAKTRRSAQGRHDGHGGGGSGGPEGEGHWESSGWDVPFRTYRTGIWMALVAIVMLFAAFTSALVVRRGISTDWRSTTLPRVLYLNTVVLMLSSLTLELSRRALRAGLGERFAGWLYATLGLGVGFIGGQLLAWRELASRGVYLATNPSSSFFYLLTAAHGVHLLGGILALSYLVFRAQRIALAAHQRAVADVTAIYWHFMDGLWIYILLLLMSRL